MLYRQSIQEQNSIPVLTKSECTESVQMLPFMQQMLDSALLKMNFNNQCNNQCNNKKLIAQSIYLINNTLLNVYKLDNTETRRLIRFFLRELSINYIRNQNTTTGCTTILLPFMKDMLDSIVLRITPTNKQIHKQIVANSIRTINHRLVNKINSNEIRSLIRLFLQELSIRCIEKNNTDTSSQSPIKLLPFMQNMLDNIRITPNNKQMQKRIISNSIRIINNRLVNKLNNNEIRQLMQLFIQELSNRFTNQNSNQCVHNTTLQPPVCNNNNTTVHPATPLCTESTQSASSLSVITTPGGGVTNVQICNTNHCIANEEENVTIALPSECVICNSQEANKIGLFENVSITIPDELCIFLR